MWTGAGRRWASSLALSSSCAYSDKRCQLPSVLHDDDEASTDLCNAAGAVLVLALVARLLAWPTASAGRRRRPAPRLRLRPAAASCISSKSLVGRPASVSSIKRSGEPAARLFRQGPAQKSGEATKGAAATAQRCDEGRGGRRPRTRPTTLVRLPNTRVDGRARGLRASAERRARLRRGGRRSPAAPRALAAASRSMSAPRRNAIPPGLAGGTDPGSVQSARSRRRHPRRLSVVDQQ